MRINFYIRKAKIKKIKINIDETVDEYNAEVFITVGCCEDDQFYNVEVYKKYFRKEDAIRFLQSLNKENLYDIEGDYCEANENEERVLWWITFDKSRTDEDATV